MQHNWRGTLRRHWSGYAASTPQGSSRLGRKGIDEALPRTVISEFDHFIGRVAAQGERRRLLEHFKGYFCGAIGSAHYWSSDEGWAYTDLLSTMEATASTSSRAARALKMALFIDERSGAWR